MKRIHGSRSKMSPLRTNSVNSTKPTQGPPRRIRSVALQLLMSCALRMQHSRGGVMSGDNPFSASNSAPNSGSHSGDSSADSKLRSASAPLPQYAIPRLELLRKQSERLGMQHQGTGVLRPGSLVSTERWPCVRAYINNLVSEVGRGPRLKLGRGWDQGSGRAGLGFSLWAAPSTTCGPKISR
jgi:hypothetical protein